MIITKTWLMPGLMLAILCASEPMWTLSVGGWPGMTIVVHVCSAHSMAIVPSDLA